MNADAPLYPTTLDSSLVPLGRLPLAGDDGSNTGVQFDPRPASEGGCSANHLEGCTVYNIKVKLSKAGSVRRVFFQVSSLSFPRKTGKSGKKIFLNFGN